MKKLVLLTGATGTMGSCALTELMKGLNQYSIRILIQNSPKNEEYIQRYANVRGLEVVFGDISKYQDAYVAVEHVDMVLHLAAFVSPAADYYPKLAMKVNFGGTKNLIDAICAQNRQEKVKFVYIGTVAQTGDRMPPIHWGRVGDPIKPSMYDYYAVSKIAAERYVVESGLKHWVSLRQTGIIGPAMSKIRDAIMYHNCLNNVLEYVSDRDSGIMLGNLWNKNINGELPENFWNHIYNIGGGASCRVDGYSLFERIYGAIGIKKLKYAVKPKMIATRNFHGHYYLDSDKLNDFLEFRNDSIEYFYSCYQKQLGGLKFISKLICKLPGGQRFMGYFIRRMFKKAEQSKLSTVNFIKNNMEKEIIAYWGSKESWEALPKNLDNFERYKEWDKVIKLDHGYDESKPENELDLSEIKKAAKFRGGECLSEQMIIGDWKSKLKFKCAFGHEFKASPRLILEGGHWCSECERSSWNYSERAKRDKFFAQVWYPLHPKNEKAFEYIKEVNELDI